MLLCHLSSVMRVYCDKMAEAQITQFLLKIVRLSAVTWSNLLTRYQLLFVKGACETFDKRMKMLFSDYVLAICLIDVDVAVFRLLQLFCRFFLKHGTEMVGLMCSL